MVAVNKSVSTHEYGNHVEHMGGQASKQMEPGAIMTGGDCVHVPMQLKNKMR